MRERSPRARGPRSLVPGRPREGAASASVSALGILGLLLLAAAPRPGEAQVSTTRGWSLDFHVQGASLTVEGEDSDTGGGAGVRVGYGFNRIVTVFLAADGATIDAESAPSDVSGEWKMAHVDLGARFHFANALRRWVPWLEAAIGARAVGLEGEGDQEDVTFSGGSFTLGGGLGIYLKESLALDLGLQVTGGEFTDLEVGAVGVSGLDIDARSTRFGVGLTWWP